MELNKFYTIGHRGNETEDPENTLSAFKRCVEYGIDIAEFDVQLSKDNIPIVFHDSSITKKTGFSGKVSDYISSDLTKIDVINRRTNARDKIISLEQLFQYIQNTKIYLQIELKGKNTAKPTIDLINKYYYEDRVYLSSFFKSELQTAKNYGPNIRRIFLVKSRDRYPWLLTESMFCKSIHKILMNLGCFGLSLHVTTVSDNILDYFKSKRYFIVAWGIKNNEQCSTILQFKNKINGFSTPDIQYVRNILNDTVN